MRLGLLNFDKLSHHNSCYTSISFEQKNHDFGIFIIAVVVTGLSPFQSNSTWQQKQKHFFLFNAECDKTMEHVSFIKYYIYVELCNIYH